MLTSTQHDSNRNHRLRVSFVSYLSPVCIPYLPCETLVNLPGVGHSQHDGLIGLQVERPVSRLVMSSHLVTGHFKGTSGHPGRTPALQLVDRFLSGWPNNRNLGQNLGPSDLRSHLLVVPKSCIDCIDGIENPQTRPRGLAY